MSVPYDRIEMAITQSPSSYVHTYGGPLQIPIVGFEIGNLVESPPLQLVARDALLVSGGTAVVGEVGYRLLNWYSQRRAFLNLESSL